MRKTNSELYYHDSGMLASIQAVSCGLAVSLLPAEGPGGTLLVASDPGEGTTITVILASGLICISNKKYLKPHRFGKVDF